MKVDEEIIEGFKETEVGLIPEDWEAIKLGDVVSKTKQKDPAKTPDWQFKYIDVSGVNRESLTVEDYNIYFGKEAPSRARKLVEIGDVIFATVRPTLKRLALIKEDFNGHICSTAFCVLRANGKKVIPQFLYFVVSREVFINELGKVQRGASYPAVTDTDVKNQKIPLPPLPEQQKIASVLSAIQEAKEKTENVISSLKELKKSMMKHLFTYGSVPVEEAEKVPLKETEIGMIPEHWALDCLGNLVNVRGGKRLPKGHSFAEDLTPFPYIRIVDFAKSSVRLSNLKYLTQMDRETIKRYIIEKEDIYISIAGTIGLVGTVPKELDGANLTENAARLILRDSKQINKIYLVDFLASECGQNEIHKRATKTSQPKLALTRIKEIPVAIPSYAEQQQIADILSAMDNKIEAEENKKQALDALFKTLLSSLMTGKFRVKDLEI